MWTVIREIWAEAMRPEDFAGRPYHAFWHQGLKVAVGAFCVCLFCVGWGAIFGEMPYRALVWGWMVGFYFGVIEVAGQGWRGRDTLWDTCFFAYGAAGPLVSLHEVAINPITLTLYEWSSFAWLIGLVVSLTVHAWAMWRKGRIQNARVNSVPQTLACSCHVLREPAPEFIRPDA